MGERVLAAASERPLPRAVRAVVLDALRLGTGQPLPTNAHYLQVCGASAGTLQRALSTLAEQQAMTTTSRGARGRVIESLHAGRAWAVAGLAPVRMLLPPSGPVEVDELAERLTDRLTELGVPHTVRHLRGGARRLEAAAADAVDIAVVSAGVLAAAGEDLGETRVLDPGSYYTAGSLVSVVRLADAAERRTRIAIDSDSPDHVALTHASYPAEAGYCYVEHPFPDVPAAVLRGDADAGIWHRAPTTVPLDLVGLGFLPLDPAAQTVWAHISAAALVSSPTRPELRAVIDAAAGLSSTSL